MDCRSGCAACCIAPTLSSAIPGMPGGKPAGVPCVQLDQQLRCKLWGHPTRPAVCDRFAAHPEHCGASRAEALIILTQLERDTAAD